MSRQTITVFRKFPKELFRATNGSVFQARDKSPERSSYDMIAHEGYVKPLALDPTTYRSPNGLRMSPNSPFQQYLISRILKRDDVTVFCVPAGTHLPEDLLLVHELQEVYSLQPAKEMKLSSFDDRVKEFFMQNATVYEKQMWLKAYPKATENLEQPWWKMRKQMAFARRAYPGPAQQ
ncbi:hypothetical protein B0T10DRAFT_488334 [Thelonectria olida]|uniref:Tse2 ADP-ribosyltransferase toxin domain-containing protein n=1 Tax=Thelonectria olida TaxID=1576542 RepID=A0A9P9ALC1_9HYPO|nr:hypothetical protein B0T10DRAFT_488334 [Thelonectria olida]